MIVIVMGVSGAGKTTVGRCLADALGWCFADADDFHSPANIAKMRAGIPLTDTDRAAWLTDLRQAAADWIRVGRSVVLACSALKQAYRSRVITDAAEFRLVYLAVDFRTAAARLSTRLDHFMSPALLKSQFALLEEPHDAIVVDGTAPVDDVVARIREALAL